MKNSNEEKNLLDSRRKFVKKAIYTAPRLVVLSTFIQPTNIFADSNGFNPNNITTTQNSNKSKGLNSGFGQ